VNLSDALSKSDLERRNYAVNAWVAETRSALARTNFSIVTCDHLRALVNDHGHHIGDDTPFNNIGSMAVVHLHTTDLSPSFNSLAMCAAKLLDSLSNSKVWRYTQNVNPLSESYKHHDLVIHWIWCLTLGIEFGLRFGDVRMQLGDWICANNGFRLMPADHFRKTSFDMPIVDVLNMDMDTLILAMKAFA